MRSISQHDRESRNRRRVTNKIKDALRGLSSQLSLLNRQVGLHAELRDVDLECLELLNREGPLTPSTLARRARLHPATLTGILDRLQRGGWIVRERDADAPDRRAVTVRVVRDRGGEVFRLYSGMNRSVDQICADYSPAELDVIADFLRRCTVAGQDATEHLTESGSSTAAPHDTSRRR
jgi:DNA-binding MarR family transcriptional regulator